MKQTGQGSSRRERRSHRFAILPSGSSFCRGGSAVPGAIVAVGLAVSCVLAGPLDAAERRNYKTYAEVVSVEPVMETRYEPVSRRVCTTPDYSARGYPEVAATIGEDIREQIRWWEQQRSCRTISETVPRERVTGYAVTYRYGGRTYSTRTVRDPGDRMLVNVSLSPLR